ncbi:hypothetical protein GIB67_006991 [Kingdonia uniflora]|uniref:Uncharacterized protein n=1 Tax=Kingdonia uniflora TaxID=39325 RepID=A0A7J7NZX9_9MAGN|nr:hypothetical protein GIB67_006991 [Kingdonia uniflora]
MEMLHPNFKALGDLHDCANGLLRSSVVQQELVQFRDKRWVDEVAEGSLGMLDACGMTRDVLLLVKEHVQDLQSSLRRRSRGESCVENRLGTYNNICRKRMKKEMLRCILALNSMRDIGGCSSSAVMDENLMVVVSVLIEARRTTISIAESIMSFVAISRPKPKWGRRSFIAKFMRAKRVANVLEENRSSEADCVDGTLIVLHECNLFEKSKLPGIRSASNRLETLKVAVESLEVELQCMFRRLIQTRVSLLNILNI